MTKNNNCVSHFNHNDLVNIPTEDMDSLQGLLHSPESKGVLRTNSWPEHLGTMPPAVFTGGEMEIVMEKEVNVNRPVYTQQEFDQRHGGLSTEKTMADRLRRLGRQVKDGCGVDCLKTVSQRIFPFINIMRKYNLKNWLVNDLIAGVTVGIMHIPQGMAYAFLAALPPVYGLYTSFFPALIYFFLGTSRQVSIGTIAVVSLMLGGLLDTAVTESVTDSTFNQTNITTNGSDTTDALETSTDMERVQLACAFSLTIGLMQLGMGILQLGFLTRYLSDPMISGFTFGTAIHVGTSQIKYVFGLTLPKMTALFRIPLTYYNIFRLIGKTNLPTFGISLISIVILIIFKQFINPRVMRKIKAPIPIELLIITAGTVASYFLDLNKDYNVKIIGRIPSGMPTPRVPQLGLVQDSLTGCFAISIIAFSITVSLGKVWAKKYNYDVDSNQELVALGVSNCFSSFFLCFPSAASLSRSSVQESMNGKTQMVSIFSCCLLVFVLLFIGPLFKTMPNCCLASLILVALKGMFMQAQELPALWKFSAWDFWNWVLTAVVVTFVSVEWGLVVGVAFSIFSVILRTQSPPGSILGRINETDLYKNIKCYEDTREIPGAKIFRYEGSLFYASTEHFRDTIYHYSGYNPYKLLLRKNKYEAKLKRVETNLQNLREGVNTAGSIAKAFDQCCALSRRRIQLSQAGSLDAPPTISATVDSNHGEGCSPTRERQLEEKRLRVLEILKPLRNPELHHIIIDCSTWNYMDFMGVKMLNFVIQEFRDFGISVFLANPKMNIREMLERCDFYEKNDRGMIYVSVHDAVISAMYEYNLVVNGDDVPNKEETKL